MNNQIEVVEDARKSPNDPKLSDGGGTAQPVPGQAAEAQDGTARSRSLERMVRRRSVPASVAFKGSSVNDLGLDAPAGVGDKFPRFVGLPTEGGSDQPDVTPAALAGFDGPVLVGHEAAATRVESDSEQKAARDTLDEWILGWIPVFPQFSGWLGDLECPVQFEKWARTPGMQHLLRSLLCRWIAHGRPQIAWQNDVRALLQWTGSSQEVS